MRNPFHSFRVDPQAVQCTVAPGVLSIYFPVTDAGPVLWHIPADVQRDPLNVKTDVAEGAPEGSPRNSIVLEHADKMHRVTLQSESAAQDAVGRIMLDLAEPRRVAQRFAPNVSGSRHRGGRFWGVLGVIAGVTLTFVVVGAIGVQHSSATPAMPAIGAQVASVNQQGSGNSSSYAAIGGLGSSPGSTTSQPSQAAAPIDPVAAMEKMTVDAEGLALLKKYRVTHGIQVGAGSDHARVLYVFSDPNCPHCRVVEKAVEQLGPDVTAVVIPVAFLPGSDISAATAMCAKDKTAAWKQVTAGLPPTQGERGAPVALCDSGKQLVSENTKLFSSVGFQYTPTFVADNGRIAIGEATAGSLRALFN
ncbi:MULTISPECIES: DsbC family protein [unclassified Burkholderia]|uniref:DsbC family protein n=1 Tax=unclassified Burkholderia TaxID=2613784 RepID=UPI002AB23559|nr:MULTISPECIES: DsbC family protein [unclassified Burkholderia]